MTQPPYDQNPYGQPAPYDPPPPARKSRTALVGIVVLVVLLITGGGLAGLLLLADPDDDDDSDKAEDKTSQTTEPTEPAGDTVQGNGYSYTLPDDWQDVTAQAQDAPGAIDTVSAWGSKLDGGRANVIVESGPAGGTDDLESLREQWTKNMAGSTGATPQEIPGTTIDGEEAIGAQFERTNENDVEIVQTAYLLVRDGTVYSIAISSKIGDDDAEQAFEEILASWAWE